MTEAIRSFSSFPARLYKPPSSKERGKRKNPLGRVSSQYSYHSSGNKVRANTVFSKPSTRIITSVASDICSVILSKNAPTISPTPKFLIVSAKNFRLMAFILPMKKRGSLSPGLLPSLSLLRFRQSPLEGGGVQAEKSGKNRKFCAEVIDTARYSLNMDTTGGKHHE